MENKIFRSTVTVAALVLLSSLICIMGCLYDYFDDAQIRHLKNELKIAAVGTEQNGATFLQELHSGEYRFTWVSEDGSVLYDTSADENQMKNHADREEIKEALANGTGDAYRRSDTLLERTIYEAIRLDNGTVLRISASQQIMLLLVLEMVHPVCVVAILAIALSLILANRMSRKIMEPLSDLDLDNPLANRTYEELSPLLKRLHQQHQQIDSQMRKLQRKADEFEQITSHMQEGLVVLDKETNIRSINPSAQRIFSVDESCVGKSFFRISRSNDLRQTLNHALDHGHGSTMMEVGNREYRFDMSSIMSGGKLLGAVLLAFDVTEQRNAERTRREFSANVSHELKTPLQGIIGSAELLGSGMVKKSDESRFIGHIRNEAKRLVSLIEDIIRLSQLDEGVALPTEEVDLLALAEEVHMILEKSAAEKNVSITVSGTGFSVTGVRRMLQEIIYNLCDNAIKYNLPGGCVNICVEGGKVTVRDTGIGIPAEHQARVFERFYRVDKSHSKASGGTGLGLSIVRHAAAYHKAELKLESTPGEGTAISVIF